MKRAALSIAIVATTFGLLGTSIPEGRAQTTIDPKLFYDTVRATLLEEDPADRYGSAIPGTARWRIETPAPDSKSDSEYRLRADIVIPERKFAAVLTIRPNLDQTLPASHFIELTFDVPPTTHGGISEVRGLLMKQAEQVRGVPLRVAVVKYPPDVFLVGLSAAHTEENIELLYGRRWLEVAIVFANGRRALLTIDKDLSGEAAFKHVFSSWKKLNPQVAKVIERIDASRQSIPQQ